MNTVELCKAHKSFRSRTLRVLTTERKVAAYNLLPTKYYHTIVDNTMLIIIAHPCIKR